MAKHLETGLRGEEAAVEYLETMGFQILHRRLRIHRTDIDIVARQPTNGTLRFVEVKTRTVPTGKAELCPDFQPAAAVSEAKSRQLIGSAEHYMRTRRQRGEMAIDLVSVILHPDGSVANIDYYADILR